VNQVGHLPIVVPGCTVSKTLKKSAFVDSLLKFNYYCADMNTIRHKHKFLLLDSTSEAYESSCRRSGTPTFYQHITTRLYCYRIHQGPAQVHAEAQGHTLLHLYLYLALEDGLLFLLFAPYIVPQGRERP